MPGSNRFSCTRVSSRSHTPSLDQRMNVRAAFHHGPSAVALPLQAAGTPRSMDRAPPTVRSSASRIVLPEVKEREKRQMDSRAYRPWLCSRSAPGCDGSLFSLCGCALLLIGFVAAPRRTELVALDVVDLVTAEGLQDHHQAQQDGSGWGGRDTWGGATGTACCSVALQRWMQAANRGRPGIPGDQPTRKEDKGAASGSCVFQAGSA